MELTLSKREAVQCQFDAFCKKVIRNEARNYMKHIAWQSKHEVSLSELSGEQSNHIYILDQYPSDVTQFTVGEHRVAVHDDRLAQALGSLDGDKRDILLLAYFLDLSDKEIADKLNVARSTIQYKRTSSLKEMRQRMEVKKYGTQTEG